MNGITLRQRRSAAPGLLESVRRRAGHLVGESSMRLVANLSALGLSQIAIRLSRIATILVLTRLLTPTDFGAAAIVLTTYELVAVFTRNGIAAHVIKADAAEFEAVARTAYWMTWIVCGGLCLLQMVIALPIALAFKRVDLALPIAAMAVIYLATPPCTIQSALLQRDGRLGVMATASAIQVVTDNVLSGVLALCGFGLWAIVLPKILVTPIWLVMNRYSHHWRPSGRPTFAGWRDIARFSANVLGVELLTTLQANVDTMIVGLLLGVEAAGIYFFAFNAGSGITLGLVNAFANAVYVHLCGARGEPGLLARRYRQCMLLLGVAIIPIVLLQSVLAPWYVPLLFGARWVAATPVLVIICLSVLPRPFATVASQLVRASGRPGIDLRWQAGLTLVLLAGLVVGAQYGIIGVAIAVMATQWSVSTAFVMVAPRQLFKQTRPAADAASAQRLHEGRPAPDGQVSKLCQSAVGSQSYA